MNFQLRPIYNFLPYGVRKVMRDGERRRHCFLSVCHETRWWSLTVLAMADNFDRAKDLFVWNERAFTPLGIWPLKTSYVRFMMCIVYLMFHIVTEVRDLLYVFGNFELMMMNLSESILAMTILVKMMVMRCSRTLKNLMEKIINGVEAKEFENDEEKEMYLYYNRISKTLFNLWYFMGFGTAIAHHMQPLEFRLKAGNYEDRKIHGRVANVLENLGEISRVIFKDLGIVFLSNESIPFVLPYRTRFFFDVNDSLTFWLVWIYQSPVIYYHAIHSVSIGYMITIVLHVCGQLSVLASRIRSLDVRLTDESQDSRSIFRDIVVMHSKIVGLTQDIDEALNLVLLEEIAVSTVLSGLAFYTALVNSDFEDKTSCFAFMSYGTTILMLIYGYCVAGEYLITESTNVCEAYYQCRWYDLPNSCTKQMVICMIGTRKPLQLTGGGFYIFSLEGYTSVLKTVMGYISMLRTIA